MEARSLVGGVLMRTFRQVKDKDLPEAVLIEKRRQERTIECESQIVNALEKGNPFSRLWTHPAGINPAFNGGCVAVDDVFDNGKDRWEKRYNALKKQREQKTMLAHVDADLMTKHVANKETDARAYKDQLQRNHDDWKKQEGVTFELTAEEIVTEHEANVVNVISQINEERAELGLHRMKIVEE